MIIKTKVALAAALVLASASGALAQNLNGFGAPAEAYPPSVSGPAYQPFAYAPDDEAGARGRHHHGSARTHQ